MTDKNIPKIFISYSWVMENRVLELAERLVADGVDVVIYKWDLKEGQDKYVFMEQAVTNPEIICVLIICDKSYSQKADDRTGGVGEETIIISSEIYGKVKQEKFIPVVLEKDENDKPYLPAYIKSRIYIDLSSEDNYEAEYEKLLRNLYGKPEYKKPKLGKAPEWLNDEDINFSTIRGLIKQINVYNGNNPSKADYFNRRAIDEFSQAIKSFGLPLDKPIDGNLLIKLIDATKPLRDYFLDYIETLISKDMPVGDIISNYFENLYNNVTDNQNLQSYYPDNLEFYYYFIWESFVCTIAILLHYEKFEEMNKILKRTYFLIDRHEGEIACTFVEFKQHFKVIESMNDSRLYTMAGDITIKREKKPIITKETITNADLFLYQMSCAFEVGGSWRWFPTLYVYYSQFQKQKIWKRLQSKRYCEKLFPLFGVNTLAGLITIIGKCVYNNEYRYGNAYWAAPNILTSIKVEEIGVLN
jgi:hypothetical protein